MTEHPRPNTGHRGGARALRGLRALAGLARLVAHRRAQRQLRWRRVLGRGGRQGVSLVGENIHRSAMSITRLECQVSKFVNSYTCPRPATGGPGPRRLLILRLGPLGRRGRRDGGRARSHCRFVPPLIPFIPESLTYSVPLFLKRQCDRTLGGRPRGLGPA
jgi:hypothetical protein